VNTVQCQIPGQLAQTTPWTRDRIHDTLNAFTLLRSTRLHRTHNYEHILDSDDTRTKSTPTDESVDAIASYSISTSGRENRLRRPAYAVTQIRTRICVDQAPTGPLVLTWRACRCIVVVVQLLCIYLEALALTGLADHPGWYPFDLPSQLIDNCDN
jgi:hypothetical protein